MSTLLITRNYADGEVLLEADLDEICDDVEAFLNSELLGDVNIADASITASDKLIDSTVSTAKLAASAVTTAKIADNAVTDAKIVSGGLAAASLATNSVTTAKIVDDAVTAAKVADGAIDDAAKLASNVVTTAKIADSNVTTAKIADGNVTQAKRASFSTSYAVGTRTSTFTTSAVCTATITGTGRPVLINLNVQPITAGAAGSIVVEDNSGSGMIGLYKNTSLVAYLFPISTLTPGASVIYVDTSGYSGSLTYDVRSTAAGATFSGNVQLVLTAVEL